MRAAPRPSSQSAARAGERVVEHVRLRLQRERAVALFSSLADEPPTRPLFAWLRSSGRRCALPRAAAGGLLEFAWVERWSDLVPGRFGVLEPPKGATVCSPGDCDLVFVPGLAFDRRGGRLGRGGGYYDRVLAGARASVSFTCGLAYASRLIERVPVEPFDVRMDAVLSEAGWLDVTGEPEP